MELNPHLYLPLLLAPVAILGALAIAARREHTLIGGLLDIMVA